MTIILFVIKYSRKREAKMKKLNSTIKTFAVIAALIGGMSAFAQDDITVKFYTGSNTYDMRGACSGFLAQEQTCTFSRANINNIRVTLSQKGIDKCFFTGGTTKQGTPYFTGDCPQVGTVQISNTPMANPNNPIIVNLPQPLLSGSVATLRQEVLQT